MPFDSSLSAGDALTFDSVPNSDILPPPPKGALQSVLAHVAGDISIAFYVQVYESFEVLM